MCRLFGVIVVVAACGRSAGQDPVATAQGFIQEARAKNCGRSFDYFTPEVQENARQFSHKARRNQPYVTEHTLPEQIFCSGYSDMKPRTARVASTRGDTAILAVTSAEGTHWPLIPFLSTPYHDWASSLTPGETS